MAVYLTFSAVQKVLSTVLLILVVSSSQSSTQKCGKGTTTGRYTNCSNDIGCPTWYTCNDQRQCTCRNDRNDAVICDAQSFRAAVLDCNCVTYNAQTKSTFAGSCYYNCINNKNIVHSWLPQNPETLINGSICTYFHRAGLLCGDCEEGRSPLVLSYNLSCVRCPDGHKNWWKFLLVAFVPLTFFYLIILLFNINVTSTRLHGVVWYSQVLSTPILARLIMPVLRQNIPTLLIPAKVIFIFFSFWNLDIFRSVLPDVCLDITTLQALALDYLIALYPFLLILVSYFIIELHDRKFVCIVTAWKPFHKLLTLIHMTYDIRTSVIDSFATFFLLAYTKVLSVTTDLLLPTRIDQLGSNKFTFGVYYTPSVQYFGDEHLPYAILALAFLTLFVIIPTLVFLLYPFQLFHKLVSFFPFNWHFLQAFIDSFQGCYKDGTEPGTFDCRWFSGCTLLIRVLFFVIFCLTLSAAFIMYAITLLVIFLMAIINVNPYKKKSVRYPSTDSVFFIFLSLFFILLLGRGAVTATKLNFVEMTIFTFIFAFIPLFYTTVLIISWLVTRFKRKQTDIYLEIH